MCFNSGSSITLINAKSYQALKAPPRLKQGRKLKLRGVGGSQELNNFIKIPLSVISDQGNLVEINVEAYVVPDMNPSFILGNDYAVQYLLSLIRDRDRSYIQLGRSKETIEVQELRSESLLDLEGNSRHIEVDVNKVSPVSPIPTKTSKRTNKK